MIAIFFLYVAGFMVNLFISGGVLMLLLEGRDTMNSRELNVNVPLATVESDSEEFEVRLF